jgi:hypothetical protein
MPPRVQKAAQKSTPPAKGDAKSGSALDPALYLSVEYGAFRRAISALTVKLEPLGLSISVVGKGIASYKAKTHKFPFDVELVRLYASYEEARLAWESFRDSFRPQTDAGKVPTGLASILLEEKKDPS